MPQATQGPRGVEPDGARELVVRIVPQAGLLHRAHAARDDRKVDASMTAPQAGEGGGDNG
jgi:hypothetical protein